MTAARVDVFRGSLPLLSDWQLQPNMAANARNCRVRSGDIEPLNLPTQIISLGQIFGAAYRIPHSPEDLWLQFDDPNTDVVEAPLVNDAFGRVYWTTPTGVRYSTTAILESHGTAWDLGVEAPTVAPDVVATSGTNQETRAYLYTRVTSYGEESAPSPPFSISGDPLHPFEISGLIGDPDGPLNRDYAKIRIYRTVVGFTTVTYFLVEEIFADQTTYTDTRSNVDVARSTVLQSAIFGEPPILDGMVVMPNGFLAGYKGRDIFFSEPFQPHSWPVNYIISAQDQIIGMAVIGNVLFIMTTGHPYTATGANPSSISLSKIDVVAPCVSKRSIVVHPQYGVIYASHNGLIRFVPGQVELITRQVIDEKQWLNEIIPSTLTAALDDIFYTAFNSFHDGFMLDIEAGNWFWLGDPFKIDRIWTDRHSGQALASSGTKVMQWNPPAGSPVLWTWVSKKFDLVSPINIGAVQVRWQPYGIVGDGDIQNLLSWNEERNLRDLAPIGRVPVGGAYTIDDPLLDPDIPQNRTPIGGSPLFGDKDLLLGNRLLNLKIEVDKGIIWNRIVEEGDIVIRPEAGYKTRFMQFTLSGSATVQSVAFAETGQELKLV